MSARQRIAVTLLACLPALASASCGFTEMHEVVLRKPGAPTSQVEVYVGKRLPDRPFYEIALLQAIGHGDDASPEKLAVALEKRAGALGCDAVVNFRFDQGTTMANAVGVCAKWASVATGDALPPAPVAAPPAASEPPPQPEPAPAAPGSI